MDDSVDDVVYVCIMCGRGGQAMHGAFIAKKLCSPGQRTCSSTVHQFHIRHKCRQTTASHHYSQIYIIYIIYKSKYRKSHG